MVSYYILQFNITLSYIENHLFIFHRERCRTNMQREHDRMRTILEAQREKALEKMKQRQQAQAQPFQPSQSSSATNYDSNKRLV